MGGILFFVNSQFGLLAAFIVMLIILCFKPSFRRFVAKAAVVIAVIYCILSVIGYVGNQYYKSVARQELQEKRAAAEEADRNFKQVFAERGVPVSLDEKELEEKYGQTHWLYFCYAELNWYYAATEDGTIVDIGYCGTGDPLQERVGANNIWPKQSVGEKVKIERGTVRYAPGQWFVREKEELLGKAKY